MNNDYLSYLMGASAISDADLARVGVNIVGRSESGSRQLSVPVSRRSEYEQLITEKLDPGFWNDLVSEDDIIFIFKFKDSSVKRFVFSKENEAEIAQLCSDFNGDSLDKTSNILNYLVANPFYDERVRRYVFKKLPGKWAAAGALFLNDEGKMLIVKPTYKPDWSIPGGNIEEYQTPSEGFRREVQEEIGLAVADAPLLHVQYVTDRGFRGDRVHFIFDGGVLSEEQIGAITLQANELSEYRFVEPHEAMTLLEKGLAMRMAAALEAKKGNRFIYAEQVVT